MSGFLFGFPSLRFLRRFRFFETMARPFAPWLLRWSTAPAGGLRQVQSRLDEAEFPTASQSALFEWTLDDWRAADGASFARRLPTPWQRPRASSPRRSEGAKKDILAADCGIFWKWHNEDRSKRAQRCPAFATGTQ